VEKGIRSRTTGLALDVIIGSLFTDIVAWFIIVACAATLFVHGMGAIQVASDAAEAMRPLAGDYAFILFAFGSSTPRSSQLPSCRSPRPIPSARAWESNPAWTRASKSTVLLLAYTLLIAGGALTVLLLPDAQLINVAILSRC